MVSEQTEENHKTPESGQPVIVRDSNLVHTECKTG
jgi:hypothetical protein